MSDIIIKIHEPENMLYFPLASRFNIYVAIQVRHYYYRLVRRVKKLLGPGFSLDARNSKDTIAAMLRW